MNGPEVGRTSDSLSDYRMDVSLPPGGGGVDWGGGKRISLF